MKRRRYFYEETKKIFATLLTLYLIFGLSTTAFATTTNGSDVPTPNADFINVCDQIFDGNGEAYTASGIDMTASFISKYSNAYQNGDYTTILAGCYSDNISQLDGHKNIASNTSTRAVLQLSYEESKVHLVTQNGFPYNGKSWYLVVTATGTYGYQDSTGQIISFPSPTINVSFSDLGALFSGSLDSIKTTTPSINGSKTSASFTVTTTHTVGCPIPGVKYVTGTLGPFTNTSNFTIKP